ncbi:hypothetical protein H0H87_012839 [Tephrocybe sp. NHM501043]|nr:hypothetical protein H0H87_012839 [Tephrocybe sp. NHM501043]
MKDPKLAQHLGSLLDKYEFPAPAIPPLSECSEVISTIREIAANIAGYKLLLSSTDYDARVILNVCQMVRFSLHDHSSDQ